MLLLLSLLIQDPLPEADPVVERRRAQAEARAEARERQRTHEQAQRVLMAVFQEDKLVELGRDELTRRMEVFDRDEDQRVALEEFKILAAWSPYRGRGNDGAMQAEDAWALLLKVADADADGLLSREEALAYFDRMDLDHDGILTRNERADGPRVGEKAPEFTLAPPNSEEIQSLSALLKDGRPVALLFGSYS